MKKAAFSGIFQSEMTEDLSKRKRSNGGPTLFGTSSARIVTLDVALGAW